MTTINEKIVRQALDARTPEAAVELQHLISKAIGATHKRPVGDRWNNQGMLTGSGSSYDHKSLELVTNMQDAVLDLFAARKFGNRSSVPFGTPHAAAESLLADLNRKQRANLAYVWIDKAGASSDKKCITMVLRDLGCGITNGDIPGGIFQVGAGHKNGVDWQLGSFGMGGTTTYKNAQSVVLVTRRHPDLLEQGQEDLISVAVVQWEREFTTTNAFYLVTAPWDAKDKSTWDQAVPFSFPASEYPEFEPGTQVALISYDTVGLGRRSGDEKSFDTVFNTRLFNPVLPITYRNNITRPDRDEFLRGLKHRLDDNPGDEGTEGQDVLPFHYNSKTYHLPIRFRIFSKRGQKGERRNFVAHGHALVLTSNGQVHSHWTPQEFKLRTKLNKLYDRVLVVVESDALPLEVRTELFTADRTQLVSSSVAMKLEEEISAFLDDWPALRDANNALIREAITGNNNDRPTLAIAQQIARAVKARGFSLGGVGIRGGGRGPKPPAPAPPEDLYEDPTHFEGPVSIEAVPGKVKGLFFKLNAKDGFISRRAKLLVSSDHPDIGSAEITVGDLRSGRLRVAIVVPENADLGTYELTVEIPAWSKSSGGLGPCFDWTTKIEIVGKDTIKPTGSRSGGSSKNGKTGPGDGGLVALVWKSDSDEDKDDWTKTTVGEILMVPGTDLAKERKEYEELAKFDTEVPTIVLNRTYSPLKDYVQARAVELTDEGKEQARERYAVGAGVALLVLDQQKKKAEKGGKPFDDTALQAGQQAAARAVLSVMPAYDKLAKEIED